MKLGAARSQYPKGWRLVDVQVDPQATRFSYCLKRDKLKQVFRREGRYLLRTNLTSGDPAELWRYYLQLTQVEEAFRNLKGDLAIRPIYHQLESRIEAHIFIAFLAYCLHVTLAQQLRGSHEGKRILLLAQVSQESHQPAARERRTHLLSCHLPFQTLHIDSVRNDL